MELIKGGKMDEVHDVEVRTVAVSEQDKDRLVALTQEMMQIQEAYRSNIKTQNFILRSYIKDGEGISNWDANTGVLTIGKESKNDGTGEGNSRI